MERGDPLHFDLYFRPLIHFLAQRGVSYGRRVFLPVFLLFSPCNLEPLTVQRAMLLVLLFVTFMGARLVVFLGFIVDFGICGSSILKGQHNDKDMSISVIISSENSSK